MNTCTLLLLKRNNELLLAMKKRGFGVGRWNGVGGKVEPHETIEQALIRECQEEIGVTPTAYEKVAIHNFTSPDRSTDTQVHTFVATAWQGTPSESEEMAPKWFKLTAIPYNDMWDDDRFWLPRVLDGQKLHTDFVFDEHERLQSQNIREVQIL